ncbi:MAG TPA: hypothetical protein VN495_00765, partial [Candidatus Paceibacterota bacterium]|nr:hypothetical protein [Candidatus Paceibacterota bacterium]
QNLLPHNQWIGLRSTTITNADGSVTVTLFMQAANGSWTQLLQAVDAGGANVGGTAPIVGAQYTGIRTDFMDVQFSNVRLMSM